MPRLASRVETAPAYGRNACLRALTAGQQAGVAKGKGCEEVLRVRVSQLSREVGVGNQGSGRVCASTRKCRVPKWNGACMWAEMVG